MATQYVNTYGASLIISYFNDRRALSEDKAIEIKNIDWRSMGVQMANPGKSIRKWYPFIKEFNGKYWLDEERLEKYYKNWKRNIVILLILSAAFIAALVILSS
jgi:hypothetical protein